MTESPPAPPEVRRRLALVLDFDDLDAASAIARRLRPWFGVAKVGLELFSAAGPAVIDRMHDLGYEVFCDLKMHDIPNTVRGAGRVLGGLGVAYVTLHTAGGEVMLRAGIEGLADGAARTGVPPAVALGVTVLTSDSDTSAFDPRLATAVAAGCGGVVCAVSEVARVKAAHPSLVTVVPGVRLAGSAPHDQARVGTPAEVVRAGGDLLVVGRTVTAADDPERAAAAVVAEVAAVLRTGGR